MQDQKKQLFKYFANERFMLRFFGMSLNPNENIGYKIRTFLIFGVLQLTYPFLTIKDLFKYELDVVADLFVYVVGAAMGELAFILI